MYYYVHIVCTHSMYIRSMYRIWGISNIFRCHISLCHSLCLPHTQQKQYHSLAPIFCFSNTFNPQPVNKNPRYRCLVPLYKY